MQTLLDTNIQLNPHTRHAQGPPSALWVPDYKAGNRLFGLTDAGGKDVVEWQRLLMHAGVFIMCVCMLLTSELCKMTTINTKAGSKANHPVLVKVFHASTMASWELWSLLLNYYQL